MALDRKGGPKGVVRPYEPVQGISDVMFASLDALEHIARALSAIDHNIESIAINSDKQTAALERLAKSQPR